MGIFGLSFKVVFPLLSLMVLGYFLKTRGLLDKSTIKSMNGLIFRVFLPVNLFMNIYSSDINKTFDLFLILYACVSLVVIFIILCLIVPAFIKDRSDKSTVIQGISRSNIILYGIFIVEAISDSDGLGLLGVMVAFVIPLLNILAVLIFEMNRGQKINAGKVLKGIASNPLIIASVLAVLMLSLKINIPALITGTLDNLSRIAAPLSMVLLGGTFVFSSVKKHIVWLAVSSIVKLVIFPAIFLSIAILIGIRGVELVVLMVVFGSPTAISSFSMAEEMGGNSALAGEIIMATSVVSIVTIFFWVYLFNVLNLI
ncbi:MAG: AEC family transporter [Eubacteriales bacterium]|nr:AEC family transporter [Eubacteriales bacterium]